MFYKTYLLSKRSHFSHYFAFVFFCLRNPNNMNSCGGLIARYSLGKKCPCQHPDLIKESSLLARATLGRSLLLRLSAAHPSICLCVHEISAFSIWRAENGKLMPRSPCSPFLSFSRSGCTRFLSFTEERELAILILSSGS